MDSGKCLRVRPGGRWYYFAVNQGMGFAKPMMYGAIGSLVVYIIAVYLGPETKGKIMTADLEVIEAVGG